MTCPELHGQEAASDQLVFVELLRPGGARNLQGVSSRSGGLIHDLYNPLDLLKLKLNSLLFLFPPKDFHSVK